MRKYVLYLALLAGLLTGCYNEEDSREHVLKYITGPTISAKVFWKISSSTTKNRREKRSGSFIRPLTSMKSC